MEEQIMEIIIAAAPSIAAIGSVGGFIAKVIAKLKSFKKQTDDVVTQVSETCGSTVKEMSAKVDKALEEFEKGKIDRQTMIDLQNNYNELKQELAATNALLKQRR